MTFARATIAGAGLAGLSAAVRLVEAGLTVRIADSAAQAGGRCRSYHDPQLGLTIAGDETPSVGELEEAVREYDLATLTLSRPHEQDVDMPDA